VESVVDNLGLRDMDVEYDWHENSPNPKVLKSARSWLIDQVKESPNMMTGRNYLLIIMLI